MRGKMQDDIFQDIKKTLASKYRFGESRHEHKAVGDDGDYIFSFSTAKTYAKWCMELGAYIRDHGEQGRHTPLEGSLPLAQAYFSDVIMQPGKYSPYTQKTVRAALAKLYGVDGRETFGDTERRHRGDIKRGRSDAPSTRRGRWKKDGSRVEIFGRGTGARRVDLAAVRGSWLKHGFNDTWYLSIPAGVSKGGRPRRAEIIDDRVVAMMQAAGDEKLFAAEELQGAPTHYWRAEYARNLYDLACGRHPDGGGKPPYICRGDMAGIVLNRAALDYVSNALGHTRIEVVANNYLYSLVE